MTVSQELSKAQQNLDIHAAFKMARERLDQQKRVFSTFEENKVKAERDFQTDDQEYEMACDLNRERGQHFWPGSPVKLTGMFGTRTFTRPSRKSVTPDVEDLCSAEGFLISGIVRNFGDKAAVMLEDLYVDVPAMLTENSKSRIASLKNGLNASFYMSAGAQTVTPLAEVIDLDIPAASIAVKLENQELIDSQIRRLEKMQRVAFNEPEPGILSGFKAFARKLSF